MKNKIIFAFFIFCAGYLANDILGNLIKPAYAYDCNCEASDLNISSYDIYDFESRVEDIIDAHYFTSNDISDFNSEVESIVEGCTADDGYIDC